MGELLPSRGPFCGFAIVRRTCGGGDPRKYFYQGVKNNGSLLLFVSSPAIPCSTGHALITMLIQMSDLHVSAG